MLHQGHPSATEMDQLVASFWWPGIYQEIREKAENCPSCRASGKNFVTQLPSTENNFISAQPTELQKFTINDSEGEMADYIVLNDSKKRARSVSPEFKQYQFFEKENKPNVLKSRFKTNKLLTAVKGTKHTITTSEGKTIHKKLASKPVNFSFQENRKKNGGQLTNAADVENSAKEDSAIHIKEC